MEKQPNLSQQKVIDDFENNLLLFASAGTGKTFTVAKKVKKAIEVGFCKPSEILALTFTIKACNELKEDISKNYKNAEITVKTIHGFCLSVLREEARRQGNFYIEPSVKDEVDVKEILKDVAERKLLKKAAKDIIGRRLKEQSVDSSFTCPVCFKKVSLVSAYEDLTCPHCGGDLSRSFYNPQFNKGSYYNFVSLLKHAREEYSIYSDDEERDFQRTFDKLLSESPNRLIKSVSNFKHGKAVCDEQFLNCMKSYAGYFMHAYCDELKEMDGLDYDDLILKTRELFSVPEVLVRWEERYKLIIVDEVQDTSVLEYETLRKLFNCRVLMCGDTFQTIYEWRGSSPQYIINSFIKDCKAKIVHLDENYRSTKTLCNAGYQYLKNSFKSAYESYLPDLKINSAQEGERIVLKECDDERGQAAWIYSELRKLKIDDPSKICIVGRSNFTIAKLEELLRREVEADGGDLKFFTLDKDFQFYRRPVSKDILAFLSLILNSKDTQSFERIALNYIKDIGKAYIRKIKEHREVGITLSSFLNERCYDDGDPYADMIDSANRGELVVYDLETTGLDRAGDCIIQIAAVKINAQGEVIESFNRFVIPETEMSEGAEKTHGYTLEKLTELNAEDTGKVLSDFCGFVRGCTLIGHNNSNYDNLILIRQLKECNISLDARNYYDTLVITRCFIPTLADYKLSTLCKEFDIVNEHAHDALSDVYATAGVAAVMLKDYILPTREKRRDVIAKNRNKFAKFFAAYSQMRKTAERDLPGNLLAQILSLCRIEYKYRTSLDAHTIADLKAVFEEGEDNCLHFVRRLLDEAAMSGSQIDTLIKRLNKIPIITVHQTKGCEFDTVFIVNADERNYPAYFAVQSGNEEEEKRVFYVAISRAKKKLYMSYCKLGQNGEIKISPYIKNIPNEFLERI